MTEQEEEIVWEVKQVLDKRTDPVTGTVEYLLEWRNWDGPPTWEPEDNCDCIFLISRFERELRRREDSTNVSPSRRTPSQARGGRSTRARRRRANQLRSSSSSTETKSDSQPPRAGRNTQAHSQSLVQVRRSDRVREASNRDIVDLTFDSSDTDDAPGHVEEMPAIEWPDHDCPRAKSPPPQQLCESSCSEMDEAKISERKLKLKHIVGAVNGNPIHLIVKWHGVSELERVPLQVLRTLYCQEILDFLIEKIRWT